MGMIRQYVTGRMLAFSVGMGTLVVVCTYFALAYYNEFRALFAKQEPKVLASVDSTKQCTIIDEKKNQHKLMFVSCSGFYDEE